MKQFAYEAIDRSGKEVSGEIEATDSVAATASLREKGLYPTHVVEKTDDASKSRPGKPKHKKGTNFYLRKILKRQRRETDRKNIWHLLGVLMLNGVPILQSLVIAMQASDFKKHKKMLGKALVAVREGEAFATSFEENIPADELEIISVAEETGQLAETLIQISETVNRRPVSVDLSKDWQLLLAERLIPFINSEVPLKVALETISRSSTNTKFSRLVSDIAESVTQGSTFSEALNQHPDIFDQAFIALIKSGELGGVLGLTLSRSREQILSEYKRYGLIQN